MIPKDAPMPDWPLYYHDTHMIHIEKGPCYIQVRNDDDGGKILLAHKITPTGKLSDSDVVRSKDLRILWPRPGAYNFPKFKVGAFVGRSPQRHMKRSAYRDHYYPLWSPTSIPSSYMMNIISLNATYWTAEEFILNTKKEKYNKSAAISSKIILWKPSPHSDIIVVYLGEEIGVLYKDKFVPNTEHDSRLPRIMRHLSMVDLI